MKVQITRTDPTAGIPDSHDPGVISVETFETWELVFDALRAYKVPLTADHEVEFRAHPDTQFSRDEFINAGHSAYMCRVHYDVRVV